MKILLIGTDASTKRFFSEVGQGHAITHCADGASALVELRTGSPHYDWIVVQGMAKALSSMEVASAIRAMGVWTPIVFIWDADQQSRETTTLPSAWRSTLARLHAQPPEPDDESELVFEYHAPLKRRSRAY